MSETLSGEVLELGDYTVTVVERGSHEAPYTYVVQAHSLQLAKRYALMAHVDRELKAFGNDDGPVHVFVGDEDTHPGLPDPQCGYAWNDLRHINFDTYAGDRQGSAEQP